MLKKISLLLCMTAFVLLNACASSSISSTASKLSPGFFANNKRIAVQDFTLADGLKTTKFTATDKALLRGIIESRLVQNTNLEIISRRNQELLLEEMGYTTESQQDPKENSQAMQEIAKKLSVDAFVYGVIYDYVERENQYALTTSIEIVSTENGRLWQSTILHITSTDTKFALFEKIGINVSNMFDNPSKKRTATTNE